MIENIVAIIWLILCVLTVAVFFVLCLKTKRELKSYKEKVDNDLAEIKKASKYVRDVCIVNIENPNDNQNMHYESSVKAGSLLTDRQIEDMCENHNLICGGYDANNIESISYNLTVDKLRKWTLDENIDNSDMNNVKIVSAPSMVIHPQEMVFVTSKETINFPANVVGRVMTRNTYIRTGLFVISPLYQPGHITKISFSVYNMSDNDIRVSENDSIAHIYFELLSQVPRKIYGESDHDKYQNEDDFRLPTKHINEHVKEKSEIDKKISRLESKIYTVVTAFMGAFVSILSLLVINFNAFEGKAVNDIINMNLSLAVCIVIILGIVLFFGYLLITMPNKKKKKRRK